MDTNVCNWYYRCEGNSSVVIYNIKIPYILRIPKIQKYIEEEYKKSIHDKILFLDQIMKPMIGQYIFYEKIVQVDKDFIKKIFHQIEQYRPGYRLIKDLSYDIDKVIQMYDLCTIHSKNSTISVEIKPKCGLLHPNNNDGISKQCYFCKHQFLKIKSKKWSFHSNYCPVDLYSGCFERMNYALNCLINTPQNNFRIFENGKVIFSNELYEKNLGEVLNKSIKVNDLQSNSLEVLKCIIIKCLLFTTDNYQQAKIQLPLHYCEFSQLKFKHNCCADCHSLPKSCVLKCLLDIQSLNVLPTAHIHQMYAVLNEHHIHCDVLHNSSTDFNVRNNPNENNKDGKSILKGDDEDNDEARDPLLFGLSFEEASIKIRNFLIARSASDSSVIISMSQIDETLCNRTLSCANRSSTASDEISKDKIIDFYCHGINMAECDKTSGKACANINDEKCNNFNDGVYNKINDAYDETYYAKRNNISVVTSNNVNISDTSGNLMTNDTIKGSNLVDKRLDSDFCSRTKDLSDNNLRNENISFKNVINDSSSSRDVLEMMEPESRTFILDVGGLKFLCRVAVIDLDVKKAEKIPYYFREDNDIAKNLIAYDLTNI